MPTDAQVAEVQTGGLTPRRTRLRRALEGGLAGLVALSGVVLSGISPAAAAAGSQIPGYLFTFAGNGNSPIPMPPFAPLSGSATNAAIGSPRGVATDKAGNVYISDFIRRWVEKVTPDGQISVVAGAGGSAPANNALAADVYFSAPKGLAVDSKGNLYIADAGSHTVYKVTVATGRLTIVAGTGTAGLPGTTIASQAKLNGPTAVAVSSTGTVYIADTGNHIVESVSDGVISVIAGTGSAGSPTEGTATQSRLFAPGGVAVDAGGNVYIASSGTYQVVKVSTTGVLTKFAGNGNGGSITEGALAKDSAMSAPTILAVDATGNLYITLKSRIARVDSSGYISTFAGGSSAAAGGSAAPSGGLATKMIFASNYAVAAGANGTVYIADEPSNQVYAVPTTPGAPSQAYVAVNGTAALVQFSAPASNDSAPMAYQVTGYTLVATDSLSNATQSTSGALSPLVISGLTKGHTYTFTVSASNAFGTGPAGPSSAPVTLISVPMPPTNVTAQTGNSVGDASAAVSFTPPSDNGGSTITSYTVTAQDVSNPGSPGDGNTCNAGPGISADWYACVVTGLRDGDTYTFTATATSSGGTSVASSPSTSVIPSSVPTTVTDLTATLVDQVGTVQVHFTPPNLHGEAFYGYIVTAVGPNGEHQSYSADASGNATLTNLAVGTWSFQETTIANPLWSAASNTAVVNVSNAPSAPTDVWVYTQDWVPAGSAFVGFSPPAVTGGANILYYSVIAHDLTDPNAPQNTLGCVAGSGYSPSWYSCLVINLTTGHQYNFTVAAGYSIPDTNFTGMSASGMSGPVTIVGPPSAPQQLSAVPSDGSVAVSFAAPADNGGGAITSYTVTAQDVTNPSSGTNGATCQVSDALNSLACTVSGLTNGDTYAFTATATNSAGTSVASLSSTLVTPQPFAVNVAVVPQSKKLQISWAPSSANSIDSYVVYTESGDGTTCTTTETTCTISWLKNGVAQVVLIDAFDDQGNLLSSVSSDPVAPAGAPFAPLNVTAIAGDHNAQVSWSAANAQGSAVTSYTVTDTQGNSCSTATLSCTVTGLAPGMSDAFFVTATNAVGTSPLSVSSNVVEISATPSAPLNIQLTPKLSALVVTWSPASTNGGSEISEYVVTDQYGNTCMTDQTSCVLSGANLANSVSDSVTVVAINLDGLVSSKSEPVIGVTGSLPDSPTGFTATSGKNSVLLQWSAPSFTGGVPILNYTVIANNGQSCTTTSLSCFFDQLAGGTTLRFRLVANNEFGSSSTASPVNGLAFDVPTAPTGVFATPQTDGSVVVQFNASNGSGLNVSNYTVSDGNGHSCQTTSTSCVVGGLTLGYTYRFFVVATNGAGDSAPSSWSADVLAAALPGAPHDVKVTGGDHSVLISWQAGADNGSIISSYKVSSEAGVLCQTSQTSCAIGGLVNGASYQFTVKASNGVGVSDQSTPSSVVVPAGAPNSPTNVTAVASDGAVTLSWSGSFANGTPVTSYSVASNDGSSCVTTDPSQTSCTVSGLVNGQTYSFYVVANSLAGSSLAASVRATPIGVTTAPQQVSVVAGNASAVISFSPPTFNGGSSVTRYVVSDGLGDTCWKGAAGSCRISGLTNGQSYTFTVVAINAAGTSSGTSAAAMPAGPPSRPTAVIAVASNGKALISWDASSANGSPVQSYTVTSSSGQSCTTALTTCVVYGLRNGQSYQFSVRAMNALGTSNASDPSNAVTPAAPPTAPQNLAATPGDGTATFTWNAPQSTNGAAVVSYRVSDGVDFCETSAKTCTVSGLINGQTYLFVAYATNSAGISLASQIVQVVPATVSKAPTVSSVTSVATGLEVAFVAPAVNGGAPVTSYLVSVNGGVTFAPVSSKSLTGSLLHLTGLTPGATYSVALKAVNSAGASPSSLAVSGNYVTTANAPKIVAVTSQKTSMVVRYSAPTSNGGAAIVAYQYSLDGGATWKLASYGTPSTINITGLSSRTTYRLELRAVNSAGIGSASSVKIVRTA